MPIIKIQVRTSEVKYSKHNQFFKYELHNAIDQNCISDVSQTYQVIEVISESSSQFDNLEYERES